MKIPRFVKHPFFWILLFMAVGLTLASAHRLEQLEAVQNPPEKKPAPLPVHAVTAGYGPISRWVCGEGNVTAVRKRHLIFKTSGSVVFLGKDAANQPLKEGAFVKGPQAGQKKGTCLAGLDNREAHEDIENIRAHQSEAGHDLSMAEAELEQAQKQERLAFQKYERSRQLHDRKIGTLNDFEEATAAWQTAVSGVKSANARIKGIHSRLKGLSTRLNQALIQQEKTAIYAPFDGVIARINIAEGDHFEPSHVDYQDQAALFATAPITIIDPGEIEVVLNLPLFDGSAVKQGQKSIISIGSMDWHQQCGLDAPAADTGRNPDAMAHAAVHSVSPVLDISSRSVRIKIRTRQSEPALSHGMFVTCWIEVEKKENALLIPTDALLFRDDQAFVFIVQNGMAIEKQIQAGLADRDQVEVLNGITAGDRVITKGRYRLYENRMVKIVGPKEDAST